MLIVAGVVVGVLFGLVASRVRRFPVAVQVLVGLIEAGALVASWYGLNSTTPRPWLAGLTAFTLAGFLGSLVELRDHAQRKQQLVHD